MAQPLKSLPLFAGEPPPPPRESFNEARSNKLWIAVHLPGLECGYADQAKLQSLAAWARRFTPLVSLAPPRALLLEVKGSLKLFGGLQSIKDALGTEIERRRLSFNQCAAPTALAALWLARCANEDVRSPAELAGRFAKLDLTATMWPPRILALLGDLGMRTVGECLRLPRDGFAQRVGAQYLAELDKALGRQFDPRLGFKPPQRLSSMLELSGEVDDLLVLYEAGLKLIEKLVEMLRSYQAQVQSFELIFHHLNGPPTTERLSLADPSHDRERFSRLLFDKLERLDLPAPVIALGLRTGRIEALTLHKPGLFVKRGRPAARASMGALIERLRGRLGRQEVFGVGLVAEHRPEAAWIKLTDMLASMDGADEPISPWAGERPLWILPAPLPLDSRCGEPYYRSRLRMEFGPERIETGWWDGRNVGRDYYVAVTDEGEKLWVFQERFVGRGWYLHGFFG